MTLTADISRSRHSESKVLNVSYLLPDYEKNSKYIEIQVMHVI